MSLQQGTRNSVDTYFDQISRGEEQGYTQGIYQASDKFQFGFVRDADVYDKDVNNYNFAKIEEKLFDIIYPIGSIYISTTQSTNPNVLFPGTNWQRIAEGKCLFGIGGNGTDTSPTITATAGGHANAFKHSHNIASHTHSVSGNTEGGGKHSHAPNSASDHFITGNGGNWYATKKKKLTDDSNGTKLMGTTDYYDGVDQPMYTTQEPAHTHEINLTSGGTELTTENTPTTSGNTDAATANLPPYIGVYIWERIGNS